LLSIFVVGQALSFVMAIIAGIALLNKQGWAWFLALGSHLLVVLIFGMAIGLLAPYTSNSRVATLAISIVSLYLLMRKDVRNYLRPPRIT
jgi:hypothetical protein